MITRIEIDGFKSFTNFVFDLQPFTVIAGVNGVGKSNLFDALRLLSSLVSMTLRESFETERGSLSDLFTLFPSGQRRQDISFAVELLVPRVIEDEFSARETLKYLRLRYEVTISRTADNFQLEKERLQIIQRGRDEFLKRYKALRRNLPPLTGGRPPFIDTENEKITISQDGNAGRKRSVSKASSKRTVLSSLTTVEFPHAYAVRHLLENIRFLQLNPESLRQPSGFAAPSVMASDGKYLAAMIARLIRSDHLVEQKIANDLADLIPSVAGFRIEQDEKREEWVIVVRHMDGYDIPSKLLSDGTLRILALIAISYDQEFDGVIILEEPENGVHPGRVAKIVSLLQGLSGDSISVGNRQVICNTHSPALIRHVADSESLAYAMPKKVVSPQFGVHTATSITYVYGEFLSGIEGRLARDQVAELLEKPAEHTLL